MSIPAWKQAIVEAKRKKEEEKPVGERERERTEMKRMKNKAATQILSLSSLPLYRRTPAWS